MWEKFKRIIWLITVIPAVVTGCTVSYGVLGSSIVFFDELKAGVIFLMKNRERLQEAVEMVHDEDNQNNWKIILSWGPGEKFPEWENRITALEKFHE